MQYQALTVFFVAQDTHFRWTDVETLLISEISLT